jgi:hypothetical protein
MSDPIVLVAKGDPEAKPRLFACAKCGSVHSPSIYACREGLALATAEEAARNCYNCREHNTCSDCGEQCPKSWTKCDPCRLKSAFERGQKVDASTIDECFGYGGDFYHDTDEAREAGEEWVYASTFRPFHLDPDNTLENILDDHFEDASESDLTGVVELRAAIAKFNAAQTSGTYDEDRTRIAVLVAPAVQP